MTQSVYKCSNFSLSPFLRAIYIEYVNAGIIDNENIHIAHYICKTIFLHLIFNILVYSFEYARTMLQNNSPAIKCKH